MRLLIAALVLVAPAHAAEMPDWIAGHWLSCAQGESVREAWTGAGDGLLAGVNVSKGRSGRPRYEFMRIAPHEGGIAFFGSPGGAPPVVFTMTSHADRRAVFENPAHDFPQRVIYAREGRNLVARVEGVTDGKLEAMEWRFRPAGPQVRCD